MDFFTYFCSMEERKYIVYIHKNKINGKVYVGITHYTNPEKRWRGGKGYSINPHFTSSINKYGWDNFEHIIIFKNIPKEVACKEEQLLIKRFKNRNLCYNISDGGESPSITESIKDKISKALKGKPKSEEHKLKCSLAIKGKHWTKNKESVNKTVTTRKLNNSYCRRPEWLWNYNKSGKNNPMFGKKHKECTLALKYKAVVQIDKNNKIINEFKSIKEAASTVNISSTHLCSALKGRSKTAAGFIWKYKEE